MISNYHFNILSLFCDIDIHIKHNASGYLFIEYNALIFTYFILKIEKKILFLIICESNHFFFVLFLFLSAPQFIDFFFSETYKIYSPEVLA